MFIFVLSYVGFSKTDINLNSVIFSQGIPNICMVENENLLLKYSNRNYLMRSLPYRGEAPPWYVPLAEFGGGLLGGAIGGVAIGFGSLFLLAIATGAQLNTVGGIAVWESSIALGGIASVFSSSFSISKTGKMLRHKNSFLSSLCGSLIGGLTFTGITYFFNTNGFLWGIPIDAPVPMVSLYLTFLSLGGTIGYQINSTYNRR